jgi:hypothetical protein
MNRSSCPSVLPRCPDGALTASVYFGTVAAAAVAPRHTRLCGGSSPVGLVRRREYVVRWLRGLAVVAEGMFHGH